MLKVSIPGRFSKKLLLLFSTISLLIVISGIIVYKSIENQVMHKSHGELSVFASVKIREVINWRNERTNDANFIYNNYQIKWLIFEFLRNVKDTTKKERIADFLRPLKENHEYTDIIIIDTTGKEYSLFSRSGNTITARDKEYFHRCIKERKVVLSDIYLDNTKTINIVQMGSFTPLILGKGNKVFAVVKIPIDPAKYLFSSIQYNSGNNETAETFIVRKEGNDVLFLNKLKYADNSMLDFRLPLTRKNLPAAMAVMGKTGIFEGLDYKGKAVLANLQKIPDSPWFIVSKIDQSELYSPVREKAIIITGFALLLVLLSGCVVIYIWKQQQYKFLEQSAKAELDKILLQERIDYLIKNANDIILLSDDKSNLVQVNDKAVQVYGYTPEEFSLLTINDIRAEHTRHDIDSNKKKVLEQNGFIFETVHVKKGGVEFPVEVSSRLIDINGQKFLQSIIRDITERKSYEEKLKNTIAELDRSNKDLEQFAYVSAHDLQEPLRMVHTFAQLIEKKYYDKLDQNANEYIYFLKEGAQRMQLLIQALLKYASINSREKNFKPVDLHEVIECVKQNMSSQIKESYAIITHYSLPVILADYSQMVLLFQNLIDNSIKYRNDKPPYIEICVERKSNEWVFSVHDNGIGISSTYFEKVFLIFQRLHERDQYPGIGFGLTLCKKIVEHHGGRIWVESEEGKGATFYFTIPRQIM